MSRSFKCRITLDFTAVFGKEVLAEIVAMPEEIRKVLEAEPGMSPQRRALGEAMLKAHNEGGLEGLCKFFLRDSAKQIRDLLMKETDHNSGAAFRKWAPPLMEITAKAPKVHQSEPTAFLDKRFNAVN
ncbi:hypothetical protein [Pseudomonas sp. SID14000]|uniref:hypothetical protein n=1 Tax=Pseudomonas sp. SID14000 TaxID=1986221 RepID=UPI000B3BE69F|nr:hypothetical protein [Pseudomonas sp. SID14000]